MLNERKERRKRGRREKERGKGRREGKERGEERRGEDPIRSPAANPVYGHTTLTITDPVSSLKLSRVRPGQYLEERKREQGS